MYIWVPIRLRYCTNLFESLKIFRDVFDNVFLFPKIIQIFSFERGTFPMLPWRIYASSGSKYYTCKGFSCQCRINRAYSSSKRKDVRRHNHFNTETGLPGCGWSRTGREWNQRKTIGKLKTLAGFVESSLICMAFWFPSLFHASKRHSPDIYKELETIMEGGPAAFLRCQCWGIRHGNNSKYSQASGTPGRRAPKAITRPQPKRSGQRRGDVGSWA